MWGDDYADDLFDAVDDDHYDDVDEIDNDDVDEMQENNDFAHDDDYSPYDNDCDFDMHSEGM